MVPITRHYSCCVSFTVNNLVWCPLLDTTAVVFEESLNYFIVVMSSYDTKPRSRRLNINNNKFVRPNGAAVGELESMSTELAEPVSAHPSPGRAQCGRACGSLVGVSALRYPNGLAGP